VPTLLNGLNDAAAAVGIAHTAVSEWSLATHHDSNVGCQSDAVMDAVYDAQSSAFRDAGVTSFFWGWKMPAAGVHQRFWSMDFFQSSVHSPRMTLAPSDGNAPGLVETGGGDGGLDGPVRPLEAATVAAVEAAAAGDGDGVAAAGDGDAAAGDGDGVLIPAADIEAAANAADAIVDADAQQQQQRQVGAVQVECS
jgi:hypothetical protein